MSYTPRRTPEQWQQLIDQQATSDLTQKTFCHQHDIRPATFGYWKRELSATSSTDQGAESFWLDLSALTTVSEQSGLWKIELDLGNGGEMIRARFDFNRAVESWFEQRYCFTHGVLLCLCLIFVQQIDFITNKGRASLVC